MRAVTQATLERTRDNVYSYRRRDERHLNLVFALAMIFCLGVWSALAYVLQATL
jgi:hypothetical protein